MKVSEVIERLKEYKEKHGDLDCNVSYFYPKKTVESELKDITLEVCTFINDETGETIGEENFIAFVGKSDNCLRL